MTPYIRVLVALCITTAAFGMFTATLVRALWLGPSEETTVAATSVPAQNALGSVPIRLRIPAISVDATVVGVGKNKSGAMAVPERYSDAGWYRYGPSPGAMGSAVIDGHVDNGFGRYGVFGRLEELQAGDVLFVDLADGATMQFVVSSVVSYPYTKVPMERVVQQSGPSMLNLITCAGSWIQGGDTYDRRLVVYSTLQ